MAEHAPSVLKVRYYNGLSSNAYDALISPATSGQSLKVDCPALGTHAQYPLKDCDILSQVSKTLPVILLPDDGRIELLTSSIPAWLESPSLLKHVMHRLEASKRWVLMATVVSVLLLFSTIKWGIPSAATAIAYKLPANTLQQIGDQTEKIILARTEKSTLPATEQARIKALYHQYFAQQGGHKFIVFSGGALLGANALALPNGTVMMTDELIQLSKNDLELIAVLAHEIGHVSKRHSLRQVISSIAISFGIMWITGDATDLVSTLPAQLMLVNYSRKFELEADQTALDFMQQHRIPLYHFANILRRIGSADDLHHAPSAQPKHDPAVKPDSDAHAKTTDTKIELAKKFVQWIERILQIFATHPDTNERIQPFIHNAVLIDGEYGPKSMHR